MDNANIKNFVDTVKQGGLEFYGLFYGIYRGIVVANSDPLGIGRIKIKVPEINGGSVLPDWAYPSFPFIGNNAGDYFPPEIGVIVWIVFQKGDARYPVYLGGYNYIDDPETLYDKKSSRVWWKGFGHVKAFFEKKVGDLYGTVKKRGIKTKGGLYVHFDDGYASHLNGKKSDEYKTTLTIGNCGDDNPDDKSMEFDAFGERIKITHDLDKPDNSWTMWDVHTIELITKNGNKITIKRSNKAQPSTKYVEDISSIELETEGGHKIKMNDANDVETGLISVETKGGHSITMNDKKDGEYFEIFDAKNNMIRSDKGGIIISDKNDNAIKMEKGVVTIITSGLIKLEKGGDASERFVLGDTFMAFFNQHYHTGNMAAKTSPPVTQMSAEQLSKISKTE
jgi:hypothetical protein